MAARAHVGSPNVFFDGNAGPYPVRVIIRPPEVIPGVAEVTVRLRDGEAHDARRVTVQPVQWQATGPKGAPPPDEARPVPGDPATWSAQLWLMTASSYSVRVHVEGAEGAGHVQVPVTAVPSRVLEMPRGMGVVLAGLGLLLFAGAVPIVGAAVRESVLAPGEAPDARRRRRALGDRHGRRALPGLRPSGAARAGGTAWSADIREGLYKPFHVRTTAQAEGGRTVLRVAIDDQRRQDSSPFMPDHGKLMHLFLLREPGLDAFAHLHPVPVAGREQEEFTATLPPLPAGTYRLYADVVHESGFPQTLVDKVTVPASSTGGPASDPDDSWHVSSRGSGGPDLAPRGP